MKPFIEFGLVTTFCGLLALSNAVPAPEPVVAAPPAAADLPPRLETPPAIPAATVSPSVVAPLASPATTPAGEVFTHPHVEQPAPRTEPGAALSMPATRYYVRDRYGRLCLANHRGEIIGPCYYTTTSNSSNCAGGSCGTSRGRFRLFGRRR